MSPLELRGRSVAGLETCIEVPSLKLLLDIGCCSRSGVNQRHVLISHGHLDHVGAVTQHAARRALLGMEEGVYFVPEQIAAHVERLFAAAGELDGQVIPRRVVPLSPEREERLGKGRILRPFRTFHRVPSQGYTVWEARTRLRPEFRGRGSDELAQLRRAGVDVTEPYEVPLLSFTGDTRVEVLEHTPELQLSECLVIEASFLDERVPVASAREMGHVHLDELVQRKELLPRTDLVLSHFSARYTKAEVAELLLRKLPDELQPHTRPLPSE